MTSHLERAVHLLNQVLEARLSGVIRYTNYSLMVSGRDRLTFFNFFTEQTNHSLRQAQETGRILIAMNERPHLSSDFSPEPSRQSAQEMLLRSLNHERQLLNLHRSLLQTVRDNNASLEDFAMRTLLDSESACRQIAHLLSGIEASACVYA